MSKVRSFAWLIVAVVCFTAAGANVHGQCGVFFRPAKTWSFPVSRIHQDSVADMTGDGLPDLVVGEQGTAGLFTRQRFFILPNLGNGNFGPPWATIEPPAGVIFNDYHSVANVNGDNKMDMLIMLTTSSIPNSFKTFINNGDGTFTAGPTNSLGTNRHLIDVNDDGFGDYLPSGAGTGYRYHPGNGDGTFGPMVTILDHTMSPGDFNGDDKTDFIDSSHLHLNNGNGTWGTIDITAVLAGSGIGSLSDFNGDGKLDVYTSNSSPPGFSILISTGTGFTRTNFPYTVDPSLIGWAWIANWGGNSAPDIVLQPQSLDKKVVLINDGTGNFPTQAVYDGRIDIITGQKSAYADFDNDGKMDRVRATSNITNARIMLKDVTSFTFEKQVCDKPGQPRIVDFNRSNSTDWSFWNPATGDWSHRTLHPTQQGPPPSEQTVNWGLGSFGDIPTPGDFDGDGITDRAVYRDSTGYWYIRRSSDLGWFVFKFGLTGDKPVPADYDGDTISDIAVWRPSDGNWYIWLMGPQQFTAAHFGSDGDKPVPADFDGDFKTDLAVFRPSNGAWYYLKSTDGNYVVVPWGISSDRPMPADFDGDGKADLNVYRGSENTMYIRRSSTGTATYYQWGVAGDYIQIGDYDGDFVADLGVYRPSNKSWWHTTIPPWGLIVYGADGVLPTSSLIRSE